MRHMMMAPRPRMMTPPAVQQALNFAGALLQSNPQLGHQLTPAFNSVLHGPNGPLAQFNSHQVSVHFNVHQALAPNGSPRAVTGNISVHTPGMHMPLLHQPPLRQVAFVQPNFVSGLRSFPSMTGTPRALVPVMATTVPATTAPFTSNPYSPYAMMAYSGGGGYGGYPMSSYGSTHGTTPASNYGDTNSGYSTQSSTSATTAPANVVTIYDGFFQPTQITVPVGASVKWMNLGSHKHTVSSDNGQWDSGNIEPGGNYSHTFTEAGTFPFHCRIHSQMRGVVVVQ
jgi:plastocyanin